MVVKSFCCEFKATNNEAEYESLILGLTLARDIHIRRLEVRCDSLLIISQINGSYAAKDSKIQAHLETAKALVKKFDLCNLQQIPIDQNTQADALENLTSTQPDYPQFLLSTSCTQPSQKRPSQSTNNLPQVNYKLPHQDGTQNNNRPQPIFITVRM